MSKAQGKFDSPVHHPFKEFCFALISNLDHDCIFRFSLKSDLSFINVMQNDKLGLFTLHISQAVLSCESGCSWPKYFCHLAKAWIYK